MAQINITNESAGVYTSIDDQSQFSPQVSETKGGVIGVANKGPVNVPVLLTGQNDFINKFGEPSLDGPGGLTAFNLLGQINQVYFTRIATSAAIASSGIITAPATSAQLIGSSFANYSFGFNQTNKQLLIKIDNNPVQGIEFEEGTYTTDQVVDIISAILSGRATVINDNGNIKITSLTSGKTSKIEISSESTAAATLGFATGIYTGVAATSAFVTSTNATGVLPGAPFSSADALDVQFDNDVNKKVSLTGSFIDGIDNIVDLVFEFNKFAAGNVDSTLGNSAVIDQEKIRFVSPTTGSTSVVEILSSTSLDVVNKLGLSALVSNPVSGMAATSATISNSKKEGYNLSSATSLKFKPDLLTEKVINFNTSGTAATSTVSFTSGTAFATNLDVVVDDWTFHYEASSGNLNTTTKEFDIATGGSNVESWIGLNNAINLYVDTVDSSFEYNSGTLTGQISLSAVEPGRSGNQIVFNTTQVSSYFDIKDPSDQTLGRGNGSSINDLSAVKIDTVVNEINRQAGSIYAFQEDGKIKLASETTGLNSKIEITGANGILGFVSGQIDNGEAVRDLLRFDGVTTGTWANGLRITTLEPTGENEVSINLIQDGVIVGQFSGRTINALSDYIETVINGNNDFVSVSYLGDIGEQVPAGLSTTLTDGDSGSFVTDQEVVNAIKLYENKEQIDISIFAAPGFSSTTILRELDRVANLRQDALFLIDPPVAYSTDQVINWHNGQPGSGNDGFPLDNKYMALYWPWVRIRDERNAQVRLVPPSTVLLERIARNDNEQFQWTAPAGTVNGALPRVLSIEVSPNQTERDKLYSDLQINNVNPLIYILTRGHVIWGQKTLQREFSALNRVNVSRLLTYVRKQVSDIALDVVFQPNDPVTWEVFVSQANKFFENIVSNRGIVQFRVVMDETTNTPQTIAQNKLFGFVTLKPRLVAEQIILTFQVTDQDFEFTN